MFAQSGILQFNTWALHPFFLRIHVNHQPLLSLLQYLLFLTTMQTRARKKAYHASSHPETKDQASPRAVLTRRSRGKAADSAKTTSRRAEATRNTRNPETIPSEAYLLTKLPVELKTEVCLSQLSLTSHLLILRSDLQPPPPA